MADAEAFTKLEKKVTALQSDNTQLLEKVRVMKTLSNEENSWEVDKLKREIAACESLLKNGEKQKRELEKTVANLQNDLTKYEGKYNPFIDDRIEKIEETLKSIVGTLNELKVARKEDTQEAEPVTYATVVKSNTANSNVALTNLLQRHDKEARSHNLIIHGAKEIKADTQKEQFYKNRHYALMLLTNLVPTLDCTIKVGKVVRIGKEEEIKTRPIKVNFHTLVEKEIIMKNLKKLKDLTQYMGVYITEDYTVAERQMVRLWVEEARKRSSNSQNYVWKVKGTPNSGLELQKFWRRKQTRLSIESTHEANQDQSIKP